jgi:hypothetical protein
MTAHDVPMMALMATTCHVAHVARHGQWAGGTWRLAHGWA